MTLPASRRFARWSPRGYTMSVAMTNCGHLGWTSHRQGYLYSPIDPQTINRGPPCRRVFHNLCQRAATAAGYPDFQPDACLYQPLRSWRETVCIRIKTNRICARQLFLFLWAYPRFFQFGGLKRNDPLKRLLLEHGDVVVRGGESRAVLSRYSTVESGVSSTHHRLPLQPDIPSGR